MGGDPVTPLCSCRGIRKRPVPKPCRFNAAPNQSHAGQKTPGQKPPPAQSHFQSKAGPAQNHAGPKAASLFRPCRWVQNHQPAPKTPGKNGSAKPPPQDAQLKAALLKPPQDALSRTARKDTRPGKRYPTNAPAKTGPRKPARKTRSARNTRKDRPANRPADRKSRENLAFRSKTVIFARTERHRRPGNIPAPATVYREKAPHEKILSVYIGTPRFPLRRSSLYI